MPSRHLPFNYLLYFNLFLTTGKTFGAKMTIDKYSFNKFTLQFRNAAIESFYRDYILERALLFCQIAWGIVIFLGGTFALLDSRIFGEKSGMVLLARIIIITLSAIVITVTFSKRLKKFLDWSSFLFVLSVGVFCIFLIAISDHTTFTPYFTGLFFAFTGIFTIAGLGFRYSFFALLINLVVFEIVFGFLIPLSPLVFLVYNFFLFGMVFIFTYIGYLVERISRENYIVSAKLRDSLDEVQTLSGLLPICAHCKKIRDDKGYWQQVEIYIEEHTEAEFSHGLCPKCVKTLYSEEEWYKRRMDKQEDHNG